MPDLADAYRFEELAHGVLGPLVLGGPVHLCRPFGATLATRLGEGRVIVDLDLASRLDVARVRRARLLAPIDTVAPVDAASITLVAALNDLLQAANHELSGPLTRGRHARLLANVVATCEHVRAPRTIAEALDRHATFARALEIQRTDAKISWWTGSASFRGQPIPTRLVAWPGIRRVQIDEKKIPLVDAATGLRAVSADDYHDVLALWLTRSPLTDLATAARAVPAFAWSASTLALVATAPGRALAYRALSRQPVDLANAALARAARGVRETFGEARHLAESFASEVAASLRIVLSEAH